jgi:putative flippase GtrA
VRKRPLLPNPQLIKYLIIGVITVSIDLGLLALLHHVFGVNVFVSATISFWTSLVFNFSANKFWTFGITENTVQHTGAYLTLIGINYLVGIGMIAASSTLGVSYLAAKLLAVMLTTCWNFLLYKHIIFVKDNVVNQLLKVIIAR